MIAQIKQDVIYKRQILEENVDLHKKFQDRINKLILMTPTSELRNDLTDLNIIFNQFTDNANKLI